MIIDDFRKMVRLKPDDTFLIDLTDDGVHNITWSAAGHKIGKLAAGLTMSGVKKGDRVAIISENRVEWVLADLAIMTAGAISVLIPAKSLSEDDIAARLRNSGSRLVFASDKFKNLPLAQVICFDDESFTSIMEMAQHDAAECALFEDDISTIIYTSGTTGSPRGVALTNVTGLRVA